ncbi:MAG: thioredoxin 1 [Bradymonadia bacterium]|jgi:thioredoxin 1
MSANFFDITDAEFDSKVLASSTPTIVDIWAPWCGPCKQLTPLLEAVAKDYAGRVNVAKLNMQENEGVPGKYGVSSLPTMLLIKDGEVVQRVSGFTRNSVIALFEQAAG